MKKTYIIPNTLVVTLHPCHLLMESLNVYRTGGDGGTVLVKEDNVSSSSRYNVWDDDWSN